MPPAKKSGAARKRTSSTAARRRQAAGEAKALRRRIYTAGALLVVAGVVVFLAARPGGGPSIPDQLKPCRYDEKVDGVDPPAGGARSKDPAPPGFHRGKDIPSDGELVRAMERGFVVLWFKPGLSADKMKQVEALSDRFGRELIVVERPSLTDDVAVTAWHKRMLCSELAPDRVAIFTNAYKDQGPEKGYL